MYSDRALARQSENGRKHMRLANAVFGSRYFASKQEAQREADTLWADLKLNDIRYKAKMAELHILCNNRRSHVKRKQTALSGFFSPKRPAKRSAVSKSPTVPSEPSNSSPPSEPSSSELNDGDGK
jgi:hypothetical protein